MGMEPLVVHSHSRDLSEPTRAPEEYSGAAAVCTPQERGGKKDTTRNLVVVQYIKTVLKLNRVSQMDDATKSVTKRKLFTPTLISLKKFLGFYQVKNKTLAESFIQTYWSSEPQRYHSACQTTKA